jgi:glutathione synthase/RimK-type ligase-like ATP-grasp enzyme
MPYLLRRPKLGKTSCNAISGFSQTKFDVYRHDQARLPSSTTELCIRWGCTANTPSKNVLNSAKAIHTVSNKTEFRRVLQAASLCPPTWFSREEFIRSAGNSVWPVIVRPEFHHQGRQLYACNTIAELDAALRRCGEHPYISKFIPKVAEYRVFCVSGRVVCVASKTPSDPDAVAWNVAKGGRFDNVRWDNWPLKAVRVSLEAYELSGLDFGGVDVMVDSDGNCFILEINAAPSLTSEYRQQCFARAFDYIVQHGKDKIPLVKERGGYTKFIHPAVAEKARV